jgi:tRNA-dihydrouridine synthase B
MEVLNRYPLSRVIVHARTADQQYEGVVDVNRAAQALALCRLPFIYNGDITDAGAFLELRTKLSGAAGWMIGRGALANPFLPSRIKGAELPGTAERRQRLLEFHRQLCEGYSRWLSGPGHWLDRMKEQWAYLALSFADPQQVVSRIRHSGNINRYTSAVGWVFDQALLGSEIRQSSRIW